MSKVIHYRKDREAACGSKSKNLTNTRKSITCIKCIRLAPDTRDQAWRAALKIWEDQGGTDEGWTRVGYKLWKDGKL